MALSPILTFTGDLAEKMQRLAEARQESVSALLENLLNQAWLQEGNGITEAIPLDEDIDDVPTPEMQTYIELHPKLKEIYFNQYVAIYQGELIDHDASHESLYRRIEEQYPDEFVWISLVEEEAIPTLVFRSPRIEWDEST